MPAADRSRLVVSAPFGNYVQPRDAVATLGTFTLEERRGRLGRILRTVWYSRRMKAWINKIGLRNPGIGWVERKVAAGKLDLSDKLVSIHGFDDQQWYGLIERLGALRPLGVELNMSCPNVGHVNWPEDLFRRAVATGCPVIAKLPPVRYETMFEQALAAGVRGFHACNTLPVPAGGMSGAPLKPVAMQCIQRLPELAGPGVREELRIIAGGGIYQPSDVDDYAALGVHAIAVGTKTMNPLYLVTHRGLDGIRSRAAELLAGRPDWLPPARSASVS